MSTGHQIEVLAQSLLAACLRDLPEIHYRDRDWAAHRAMMDGMTREQKAELVAKERTSGQPEGPFIEKPRRATADDCEVVMFPQTWPSTALGFGGIGGQAFTSAYTVVVSCDMAGAAAVYFGGRFAYLVEHARQNEAFRQDVAGHSMADCRAAGRYGPASDERHAKPAIEVCRGTFQLPGGDAVTVGFDVPAGATQDEKDLAFFRALVQQATHFDYLALGDAS